MTLEEFAAAVEARVPTAAELVGFVRGRGWEIGLAGETPRLNGVPAADRPVAVATAAVLGREPYRSGVLELLRAEPVRESPPPDRMERVLARLEQLAGEVRAPAVGRGPEPEVCRTCRATVFLPGPEVAATCPHPPHLPCPYFRLGR